MSSGGWKKVTDFLFSSDERIFMFVMNQLRKKLGNRPPIQKKAKTKESKAAIDEKKRKVYE